MRALAIALCVLIGLAGCSTPGVPMAAATADAEGKTFAAPASDMAALYIAHVDSYSGTPAINVSVGQRQLGGLTNDSWFRIELPPGRYDVRATGRDGSGSFPLQLESGQTRFLTVKYARMSLTGVISEVSSAEGRKIVLAGRRALETQ